MPGLLRGVARTAVVAGTATAVSGRVQRRQQGRWAAQEAQQQAADYPPQYAQPQYAEPQYAAPAPAPAAPATPAGDTTIQRLQELAALRDQGILTEEEFAAQKARILAG